MANKHLKRKSMKRRNHRSRFSKKQTGGYGAGSGPIGAPWTSEPASWPGVAVLGGADTQGVMSSNHYPLSPNGIAVGGTMLAEPEVKFSGGARRKSRKHRSKKRHGRKVRVTKRKMRRGHRTGGGRRMGRRIGMRGGFGPQDVINGGRSLVYGLSNVYNNFMGNEHLSNPSPLVQPINSTEFPNNVIAPNPVDLQKAFSQAGAAAAPL